MYKPNPNRPKMVSAISQCRPILTQPNPSVVLRSMMLSVDVDDSFLTIAALVRVKNRHNRTTVVQNCTTGGADMLETRWDDIRIAWQVAESDRKSTRLNSSHVKISYAVFCLKKKTLDKAL